LSLEIVQPLYSRTRRPPFRRRRAAEFAPSVHKHAALFQRIATPVGLLGRVANGVRQCRFGDLAWEMCFLTAPIEAKSEGWDAPSDGDVLSGIANVNFIFKDVAPGNLMTIWHETYYPGVVPVLQLSWPDFSGKYPWMVGADPAMRQDVAYAKKPFLSLVDFSID
jgi:hypothetical protein